MEMTPAEKVLLLDLLEKLEPGFLPYEVFKQFARIMALPIAELVPLRVNEYGEVEVLLLERARTDDIWPGELHVPGTVIRATDENWEQAFRRIRSDELNGLSISTPRFVETVIHQSKRGTEVAQVYWVEVTEAPSIGKFYEAGALPANLMASQKDFISQAVEHYRASQKRWA